MEVETWKPAPESGWDRLYEVSNLGRVRRTETQRIVQWRHIDRDGYVRVQFKDSGFRVWRKVHIMVAKLFVENPEKLREVNHEDFDKTNCAASNLAWSTRSANMKHCVENHRARGTYLNKQAKLTDEDVHAIREMRAQKATYKSIAERFGVSDNIVGQILRGKRWVHVPVRT